jgi:type I restriction enzyme S subunit
MPMTFAAATNQACAALISDRLPETTFHFVFYYWMSQYQCLRAESSGGNQQNLNLGIIKQWEILLPPLPEQEEIVRRITEFFALADEIEVRYTKAKTHVDRITQSILVKAFQGELIAQDPDDEPAMALLKRLKTAPSDAPTAKRYARPPKVNG